MTTDNVKPKKWNANTVYRADYDPDLAYETLSSGSGLPAVAKALGISLRTIDKWRVTYPEFSDAIDAGQAASEEWWDERAQEHLITTQAYQGEKTNFDTKMYIFTKKTRFRARENEPLSIIVNASEQDSDKVAELVKRLHSDMI